MTETFVATLSTVSIIAVYVLTLFVAMRILASVIGISRTPWDTREIVVFVTFALLAADSASSEGQTRGMFLNLMAMLLLLIPVIQPFCKHATWANPSFVTVMALLGLARITTKIHNPYPWNNFTCSPMFANRQWYRHPAHGPMYLDRDLLHFVEPICDEINQSNANSELLSLPYAYPNYFCATTPWHGYIQTYFDTPSRSTINRLMAELNTAPPQWIVYQRQLNILSGAERYYNHGQPLAHRDLDTLILQKIATGQWRLIDKVNYFEGEGWLIIKTQH